MMKLLGRLPRIVAALHVSSYAACAGLQSLRLLRWVIPDRDWSCLVSGESFQRGRHSHRAHGRWSLARAWYNKLFRQYYGHRRAAFLTWRLAPACSIANIERTARSPVHFPDLQRSLESQWSCRCARRHVLLRIVSFAHNTARTVPESHPELSWPFLLLYGGVWWNSCLHCLRRWRPCLGQQPQKKCRQWHSSTAFLRTWSLWRYTFWCQTCEKIHASGVGYHTCLREL